MEEKTTQRDFAIDVWKGMLVCSMVWAHVIQLMGDRNHYRVQREISDFVDVSTFSSFFLSFGYVTYLSYFSRRVNLWRIGISFLNILFSYFLLSFTIQFLILHEIDTRTIIIETLSFRKMTIYTEFLPAFGLILMIGAMWAKPLGRMVQSPDRLLIFSSLFLLITLIPDDYFKSPQLALFLGASASGARTYPLAEYMPLFLIGLYFARHQIKSHRAWFMIGVMGVASFYIYKFLWGLPERFPPSLAWVLFSIFFAVCGYQLIRIIRFPAVLAEYVSVIGANTLFFLVVSTIFIVILQKHYDDLNTLLTLLITIGIMISTYFLKGLILRTRTNG